MPDVDGGPNFHAATEQSLWEPSKSSSREGTERAAPVGSSAAGSDESWEARSVKTKTAFSGTPGASESEMAKYGLWSNSASR